LSQHGVDHDNTVGVHLGLAALGTDLVHGVSSLHGVLASVVGLAVDIQGVSGIRIGGVVGHVTLGDGGGVSSQSSFLDGGIDGLGVLVEPLITGAAPLIDGAAVGYSQ